MSQRSLWIWVCGAVIFMTACGGTSVQSATPRPEVTEGGGSAMRGTRTEGTSSLGGGAEPSPAIDSERDSEAAPSSCSTPVFTEHYTDLELIDFINPTIVTSGNWLKNRQYHKVVTDSENNAPEVPVYAPSDAVATGVTYYLGQMTAWSGERFELGQYDLRFDAGCGVTFGFDHLSRLEEPFASLAPIEPVRDTRDAELRLRIDVEAGQLIGWTSGTEPAHTWDFIVADSGVVNAFANQARYEGSGDLRRLLHAVCPYEYFPSDLAAAYRAKFGNWQGRASDAGCRVPSDAPGTLAGGWFQSPFEDANAHADWGLVATLAADGYLDLNGPGAALRISPEHPSFLDPAEMTLAHCYEHYQGGRWAYVALTSDVTLVAAFGEGGCPSSLPATHQVFHR